MYFVSDRPPHARDISPSFLHQKSFGTTKKSSHAPTVILYSSVAEGLRGLTLEPNCINAAPRKFFQELSLKQLISSRFILILVPVQFLKRVPCGARLGIWLVCYVRRPSADGRRNPLLFFCNVGDTRFNPIWLKSPQIIPKTYFILQFHVTLPFITLYR